MPIRLKAIKPGKLPSGADYTKAIQKAVQKTARLVERDLESTTRTWKHKPQFDVIVAQTDEDYLITAGTNDEIYGYVDRGTRPHIIRPRRSRYLSFRVGGRPKSRVGVIGSQAGSVGNDWRRAFAVLHPGTAARKFTETIRQRRQTTLYQEVSQAVAKVNRTQK